MRDAKVEGGMEEGAHGPEMAALNPARSKTGFARHTKAPRREMRETKKKNEREREGTFPLATFSPAFFSRR